MNRVGLGAAAALSVALLVGLVYASSANSVFGSNSIPSNAPANSVVTLHHRQALVTCSLQQASISMNSPVMCGNWIVTLAGVSNSMGNLSMARFDIGLAGSGNTVTPFREITVFQGISGRVCMHSAEGGMMADEGMGAGHSCIFVTLDSASSTSNTAVVQLLGLSFLRPMHGHEAEANEIEGNESEQEGPQGHGRGG